MAEDKPKLGRPKVFIDENAVIAMAERGWSIAGIAAALRVGEETVRVRFGAKIQIAKTHGSQKLLDVLWQRGVKEKSDRVLLNLADRIIGPTPREPEQMQQVNVQINNASRLPREELTKRIDALNDEDDE